MLLARSERTPIVLLFLFLYTTRYTASIYAMNDAWQRAPLYTRGRKGYLLVVCSISSSLQALDAMVSRGSRPGNRSFLLTFGNRQWTWPWCFLLLFVCQLYIYAIAEHQASSLRVSYLDHAPFQRPTFDLLNDNV